MNDFYLVQKKINFLINDIKIAKEKVEMIIKNLETGKKISTGVGIFCVGGMILSGGLLAPILGFGAGSCAGGAIINKKNREKCKYIIDRLITILIKVNKLDYENQKLEVMITNNHIIDEEIIKENNNIRVTLNDDKRKIDIKIDIW